MKLILKATFEAEANFKKTFEQILKMLLLKILKTQLLK